jgi:alkylation response protein AidB-like acyl-CoA dehydrogenase
VLTFDPSLSEVERAMQATAHRFAAEVLRPQGRIIDRLAPEAAIAADSPYWQVLDQYRALGLNMVDVAAEMPAVDAARLACVVNEELGWGDAGLGFSLYVQGLPAMMARQCGNAAAMTHFRFDQVGCFALTEPDHGSDLVDFAKAVSPPEQGLGRSNCRARRDGASVILSGQKSAWVSNSGIAQTMVLCCRYDDGSGAAGGGVFLVPLDAPGVRRGRPTDKIGLRALNQGEIFFDEVRLPLDYVVAGPDRYARVLGDLLTAFNPGMGIFMLGVARAAYEHALDYAKQRIQGGRPIFDHPTVRARLFEMFRKLAAARALNWQVVLTHATSAEPRFELAVSAKVTSTQTAWELAHESIGILGGAGISREYPVEKLLRDARMALIADGTNEVLSLMAASRL